MSADPIAIYGGCLKFTPAGEPCERPRGHRGVHCLKFDKVAYGQRWRDKNRDLWNSYGGKLREERRARIDAVKLGDGCYDCGYAKHAVALQFDHVRGEKSFTIGAGNMTAHSIDDLSAEILKCVVRCANCHAVVTKDRRESVSSVS